VRSPRYLHADFLVSDKPGFLVEFDESQHFTLCREISLMSYPADIRFGFDREKWIALCKSIRARDNDPPFRDEQRAWYDTLRDFLCVTRGMNSTIRLYAEEFKWCELFAYRSSDVRHSRKSLANGPLFWKLDFRVPTTPLFARIIIDGSWGGDIDLARAVLLDVHAKWPQENVSPQLRHVAHL